MPVRVVTDSSACVTSPDVVVVPLRIHLAGEVLEDGAPGVAERVYTAIAAGETVKSAPPSPAELVRVLEADPDPAVIITPAREFTTIHRNALVAASLCSRRCAVIDSRTAAAAHGLVVRAAAEAAAAGEQLPGVVAAAEDAVRRVRLVAYLEETSLLRASGRVPARVLEVDSRRYPTFTLEHGQVRRTGATRSETRALARLVAWWERDGRPAAVVFHGDRTDAAGRLALEVGAADVVPFTPAMAVHTGPGVVGVAWLREEDAG